MDNDYLIIGLGNPGDKYHETRHNVGFIIVDELARRWRDEIRVEKWQARSCRLSKWGVKLILVKPYTFMNLSGKAVAEFVRFYKIPVENVLVIHDDLDMHPGRLKMVKGGGAGGHNGIKSITQCIGSNNFLRLKVGIGRPGKGDVHPDFPVDKYVLSTMDSAEQDLLAERITTIEEGLQLLVEAGVPRAMNLINSVK